MKTHSAGIIPYRIRENGIEFFVGHPGGPLWSNREYYALLKGHVEEGEEVFDAAMREFHEESGVMINKDRSEFIDLGSVSQNSTKTVSAFGVEYDIDETKCFSNTCDVEYPSKSGKIISVPEMDRYCWLTYDKIVNVTSKKHIPFYDKIMEAIGHDRNNQG